LACGPARSGICARGWREREGGTTRRLRIAACGRAWQCPPRQPHCRGRLEMDPPCRFRTDPLGVC